MMTWKLTTGDQALLELFDSDAPSRTAKDLVVALASLKAKRLTVTIKTATCSPEDGLALYGALRRWPGELRTYVEFACNGGSVVAAAADAGNRLIAPDGILLFQPPTIWEVANIEDMSARLRSLTASLAGVFGDRLGWTPAAWDETLGRQTWFTAELAVREGLATAIVTKAEAKRWTAKSQVRPGATRPQERQAEAGLADVGPGPAIIAGLREAAT